MMFNNRAKENEIMDDLSLGGEVMDRTLRELEIVNKRLGGNRLIKDGLNKIYKTLRPDFPKAYFKNNPLSIADLGCGGGDLPRVIAMWARKRDIPVKITGIDANANVISYAKANSTEFPEIVYEQKDITDPVFQNESYDIIVCSYFLHHFEDEALVELLKQLYQQSNHAILINDIHRHWFAYYSIKYLTRIFSKSYMVKNDAALSVARAFKKKEIKHYLNQAGIQNYKISWKWAFRYQVIIFENKY